MMLKATSLFEQTQLTGNHNLPSPTAVLTHVFSDAKLQSSLSLATMLGSWGYDSSKGLSYLVPIVTAMIKVCSENGNFVIWKTHQAPFIEDSDTYLLSKYQLCSNGTHVDLCSIHHKVRPGVKGTQCIWSYSPRQSLKVNLTNLGGTMGVKTYPILPGDTTKIPSP